MFWFDILKRQLLSNGSAGSEIRVFGEDVSDARAIYRLFKGEFRRLYDAVSIPNAVCDAAGNLWNAQWGAGRVAAYAPDGRFLQVFAVPGIHSTCLAFGGADLCDLYVTSAQEAIGPAYLTEADGQTFVIPGAGQGQAEHRVIL